jgi:hypothetical protein
LAITAAKPSPGRRLARWLFVNRRRGGITVAQRPNVRLGIYIVAAALPHVVHLHGTTKDAVQIIGETALILWAIDELLRGVNPFRRLLGGAILVATIVHVAA